MQKKVVLKSVKKDLKGVVPANMGAEVVYNVSHNDLKVTVEQDLILRRDPEGWAAEMPMDGFPKQVSAKDAALKLAEWMEKMAEAIRSGEYENIDLRNL